MHLSKERAALARSALRSRIATITEEIAGDPFGKRPPLVGELAKAIADLEAFERSQVREVCKGC